LHAAVIIILSTTALSRAHTSAKAADVAKLLLLNKYYTPSHAEGVYYLFVFVFVFGLHLNVTVTLPNNVIRTTTKR